MIKALILATFCLPFALTSALAGLQDFDISTTREKLSQDRGRDSGNMTVTSREIRYRIDVKSRSFKPLSNVEVKYNIVYQDQQEGSKDDGLLQSHKGSQKFDKVDPNGSLVVSTEPFQLTTHQLDGNWVWANGASNKASDRVVGIWTRIYVDGQLKQEYCNPSTLSKKVDWKD
ncbi:hypothetical protein TSACC_23232 [Terrimicrobium sacchariphilum]|uniref:Uncharacterized protein n=1 Tax=Terrimicrobium sacchariphilum TaxID=690879 RepID=A0A146GE82_TERSA|nr:hypothetical protein [Terrimicrobium sacchariphilum]GAT34798.1 hypothetical protein TSACC_23232 [Terrimicrobium sacchariphilum]